MEIVTYKDISWEPLPEKQAARIKCFHHCKTDNEENWNKYYEWYIEIGEKLEKAFKSIVN